MRKYTNQGKSDTRSGFGAGLVEAGRIFVKSVLFVVVVCCLHSCCKLIDHILFPPLFENEPEHGTEVFRYSIDCFVNNDRIESSYTRAYDKTHYKKGDWVFFTPGFSGLSFNEEKQFSGVNYNDLSFYLNIGDDFYFHISGDGKGPFQEGVEYNTTECTVFYFPNAAPHVHSLDYFRLFDDPSRYIKNVEIKLLSRSFKFGYSKMEDPAVGVIGVLDFYFDFDEVILSAPDDQHTLEIGDTVRVSNGHFVQSLLGCDLNTLHQLISPR